MIESSDQLEASELRLSWHWWLVVVAMVVITLFLFPMAWATFEGFSPEPDYRVPYPMSCDYWMYQRWCENSVRNYQYLVLGDSVVWGQYVKPDQTLTHHLNALATEEAFANLGLDGLHPIAMDGLVKHYASDITNKPVLLHLNPLWMSSKKHDLQLEEEFRFNHPRLVPQIRPDIASYNPAFSQIASVLAERTIPFFAWKSHVRMAWFENMSIQDWTIEQPYKNPLAAITLDLPVPDNEPKSAPIDWKQRGISQQDFPWVEVHTSIQWASYKSVLETLFRRQNHVFVVLGPLNPYILTEKSKARYNKLLAEIDRWLIENKIPSLLVQELPSPYYADASHPLREGYEHIAVQLYSSKSFQIWMSGAERTYAK